MREAEVFTIWGTDRTPYMTRVILGSLRIHLFHRGDIDPDPHDHPADFWTFPLVSYVERPHNGQPRVVKAFRFHRRKAEFAHSVVGSFDGKYRGLSIMEWAAGFSPEPIAGTRPIVTIVWWGKKRRDWGFHTAHGWVPWQVYTANSGPPSDAS